MAEVWEVPCVVSNATPLKVLMIGKASKASKDLFGGLCQANARPSRSFIIRFIIHTNQSVSGVNKYSKHTMKRDLEITFIFFVSPFRLPNI
jgi:hypothetical protein